MDARTNVSSPGLPKYIGAPWLRRGKPVGSNRTRGFNNNFAYFEAASSSLRKLLTVIPRHLLHVTMDH